jgi:hypothetical protein
MVTRTDDLALNFLAEFKCARTRTLAKLFYPSLRDAQYRLANLNKHKFVQRDALFYNKEYVYFLKKSSQLRHQMILSDFYCELKSQAIINKFKVEPTISNIRPDALIAYTHDNKTVVAFLEIELSNKGLDILKYENLYKSEEYKIVLPIFPKIIVVTDRKIPKTDLEIQTISTDLSNFKL